MKTIVSILLTVILSGCSTIPSRRAKSKQPESSLRELLDAEKFHAAMRALPGVMEEWADYTPRTGETAEGAAEYDYAITLEMVAEKGDAEWGKVLDAPEISYAYKTSMIFEIVEKRLGKGSIWSPNENLIIMPQQGRSDSFAEAKAVLQQALRESKGQTTESLPVHSTDEE